MLPKFDILVTNLGSSLYETYPGSKYSDRRFIFALLTL